MSGPRVPAYADRSGCDALESISPRIASTTVPGSRRTSTSQLLGMLFSFVAISTGAHRQPHGVQGAVRRHLHAVDHVLQEEQAPTAWSLLAAQLQLDVGHLAFDMVGAIPAPVGDRDRDG